MPKLFFPSRIEGQGEGAVNTPAPEGMENHLISRDGPEAEPQA